MAVRALGCDPGCRLRLPAMIDRAQKLATQEWRNIAVLAEALLLHERLDYDQALLAGNSRGRCLSEQ